MFQLSRSDQPAASKGKSKHRSYAGETPSGWIAAVALDSSTIFAIISHEGQIIIIGPPAFASSDEASHSSSNSSAPLENHVLSFDASKSLRSTLSDIYKKRITRARCGAVYSNGSISYSEVYHDAEDSGSYIIGENSDEHHFLSQLEAKGNFQLEFVSPTQLGVIERDTCVMSGDWKNPSGSIWISVGVAIDYRVYQAYNNDADQVQAFVDVQYTAMSVIYSQQFGVMFQVAMIVICPHYSFCYEARFLNHPLPDDGGPINIGRTWTDSNDIQWNNPPFSNQTSDCNDSIGFSLSDLTEWRSTFQTSTLSIWHLFSGWLCASNVVGLANVNELCTNAATGVTWSSSSDAFHIAAHGIGHNFGSFHTSDGGIMGGGIDPTTGLRQFSQQSRDQICPKLQELVSKRDELNLQYAPFCITNITSSPPAYQATCGDGTVQPWEECDTGDALSTCCDSSTCKFSLPSAQRFRGECCDESTCQYRSMATRCGPNTVMVAQAVASNNMSLLSSDLYLSIGYCNWGECAVSKCPAYQNIASCAVRGFLVNSCTESCRSLSDTDANDSIEFAKCTYAVNLTGKGITIDSKRELCVSSSKLCALYAYRASGWKSVGAPAGCCKRSVKCTRTYATSVADAYGTLAAVERVVTEVLSNRLLCYYAEGFRREPIEYSCRCS